MLGRSRFLFFVLLAFTSLFTSIGVVGCASQPAAYTAAATPLQSNLVDDFDRYVAAETDAATKAECQAMSTEFRAAIVAGNAKSAAAKWFGPGNIRTRLLQYWSADPKFGSPGGVELMQIKVHNVEAFDYILGVGDQQQTPK